jgi:predicted dehydrogenase
LLAGELERVHGEQVTGASGVDELFTGTMRLPSELFAQFDAGLALPERDELEAIGEEGSLFLDDPWHCKRPVIELRTAGGVEEIAVEPMDSYRLELENLSAAIRGEAQPLLGREDAVGQARAIEALYRSAAEGRPVSI